MDPRRGQLLKVFKEDVVNEILEGCEPDAKVGDLVHSHIYGVPLHDNVLNHFANLGLSARLEERLRPMVADFEERDAWIGMSMRQFVSKAARATIKYNIEIH